MFPNNIDDWFCVKSCADNVSMIWEGRIKPEYGANFWYVRGRDKSLLIDSGFGMVSIVKSLPFIDPASTIAVATHTHCDHIGGFHEFGDVAIHSDEADILRNPNLENTVAVGYVGRNIFVNEEDSLQFEEQRFGIRGVEPSRMLSDGDFLDLGDRAFQVIHVPGHSPGGIALFEHSTGILFSGDVVHAGSRGIGRHMLYHSNLDDWLISAEKLRRLPVRIVHPGHFGSFGYDRYLQIIDEYLDRRKAPDFPLILNEH